MNWFTTLQIPKASKSIGYNHRILSLGSCFAQVIGEQLQQRKFNTLINPFGTLFNPISICKALSGAMNESTPNTSLINERDGEFFHYDFHSDLHGASKASLLKEIQFRQQEVSKFLQRTDVLILTFGTTWVYALKGTTDALANCHKQPQALFEKRLLSLDEMKAITQKLISQLNSIHPNISIILTVSPVRHLKDGIPQNQLSKSLLRVLCAELERENANTSYFPAYEIMMDELREYRFYKTDRIHPTQEAEEYIWKKWSEAHLSPAALETGKKIEKINAKLQHRSLNQKSESHRKFLLNLKQELERFDPEFDFSNEIQQLNQQLSQGSKA